jgi:hypothetical protein
MGRIERGAPPAGVGLRGKGAADGAHSGAPGAAGLGGRRSRQGALGPPGRARSAPSPGGTTYRITDEPDCFLNITHR